MLSYSLTPGVAVGNADLQNGGLRHAKQASFMTVMVWFLLEYFIESKVSVHTYYFRILEFSD